MCVSSFIRCLGSNMIPPHAGGGDGARVLKLLTHVRSIIHAGNPAFAFGVEIEVIIFQFLFLDGLEEFVELGLEGLVGLAGLVGLVGPVQVLL